jgi:hypothetical protein
VGAVGNYLGGAVFFQRLGGLAQGAGGIDHVVDHEAGAAFTSPMMCITSDFIGLLAALVDDGQITSSCLAKARARTTPPMSGETIMVFKALAFDVVDQHREP